MTGYLSNMNLSDKTLIEQAAKNTGFNVEFHDHPMPKTNEDWLDDDFQYYNPEALMGLYGSVYSNEAADRDHGPFWNEVDRLRKDA